MKHPCPHCGKEIDPAQILGSIRTPKKEAAWKANGERLKKMYADARKVGESKTVYTIPPTFPGPTPPYEGGTEWNTNIPEKSLGIAPKGSFSKDDLKALIAGKGAVIGAPEVDLQNHPSAPFDLDIEGEPHRVSQLGRKGLWLFYVGPDGLKPLRALVPGELEKFWEARKK